MTNKPTPQAKRRRITSSIRAQSPRILIYAPTDERAERLAHHLVDDWCDLHVTARPADLIAQVKAREWDAVLIEAGRGAYEAKRVLLGVAESQPDLPIVAVVDESAEEVLELADATAQEVVPKGRICREYLWCALRCVIESRRAEALTERLIHADRLSSIGYLASGVAHEIKNPTTFIMSNLELMAELLPTVAEACGDGHSAAGAIETMRDGVADSLDGVHRIDSIARSLGTFSRAEEATVEWVDVNGAVEAALAMVTTQLRYRAEVVTDFGSLPRLAAVPSRLVQVFTNLLVNAGQAVDERGPENNRVTIRTRVHDARIEVSVEDTGCGIGPASMERIFDPFYTTKPSGVGTGLGLALSQDLIEMHRGAISVRSAVGEGSIFTVSLPLQNDLWSPKPATRRPSGPVQKPVVTQATPAGPSPEDKGTAIGAILFEERRE